MHLLCYWDFLREKKNKMKKIKFRGALWRFSKDYEDEVRITFQVPSSEIEEVSKIPSQKELIIEVSETNGES